MKKLKGMTLMEIVISMAIYGLLALLTVEIMTSMNTLMRATDQLNDRLTYEAKYADNFQTVNDSGTPFDSTTVTYSIQYGSNWIGDASRQAVEYTIGYDESRINGTNYVGDINYRFMSFDKVLSETSECPKHGFEVLLRVVPYFSDDPPATIEEKKNLITKANTALTQIGTLKIDIDSASSFSQNDEADTIDTAQGKSMTLDLSTNKLGNPYYIYLHNNSRGVTEDIKNVFTTFTFNMTKDALGGGQVAWVDNSTAKVYMYVKVGADKNTATFYKRCVLEFNINTGQFKPYKSLTTTETPMPTDKFEVIMGTEIE